MKIDKKIIITIVSTVVGVLVLWGIISLIGHGRYDRNDFGRNFGAPGCGIRQWNPAQMMSGMENIIATKDYAAFQTLFSGSRMAETINTPEKFAARVEFQTQFWSGDKGGFGPMMFGGKQDWPQGCPMMGGRWDERWNMMRRR